MSAFKFEPGQRVVAISGLFYGGIDIGGWQGTVGQVWPKAGLLEENQYNVCMDALANRLGPGYIVFNEGQLKPDILEELAGI